MNIENNFWKEFPELMFPEELNNLHTSDKSKHKEESSKIMWAVYMITSPQSVYYNHPNKEDVVAKDFLKNPKFKWSTIKSIVNFYKSGVLSIAEQSLSTWNEMMILRDRTLKDLYAAAAKTKNVDDLVTIDKMMSNTAKMFADYKKIKEDFEVEKNKNKRSKTVSLADEDDV